MEFRRVISVNIRPCTAVVNREITDQGQTFFIPGCKHIYFCCFLVWGSAGIDFPLPFYAQEFPVLTCRSDYNACVHVCAVF